MREGTFGTFLPYARKGLEELIKRYRRKYSKKTGNRFSIDGVAYQIGPMGVEEEGALELEISSKIPSDESWSKSKLTDYVEMLEQEFLSLVDRNVEIKSMRIKDKKLRGRVYERQFFVFTTTLSDEDLYDDKEISKQAERVKSGKSKLDLSGYYPWASLSGKLVLRSVKSSTKKEAEKLVDALIEANKRVMKAYSE